MLRYFFVLAALSMALVAMLGSGTFFTGAAKAEVASYYGYESGSVTASGEVFDPSGFTAAHPFLPFGTTLTVCYQGCVDVVVTDRGPFTGGRDLDLSLGAAQAIGMIGAGVAEVDVTVH